MLNDKEIKKITELRSKGLSISKIAGELGLSRPTILKYLDKDGLSSDRKPDSEHIRNEDFQPEALIPLSRSHGNLSEPLQSMTTDVEMTRLKLKKTKIKKSISTLTRTEKEILNGMLCDFLILKNQSMEMLIPLHWVNLLTNWDDEDELAKNNKAWAKIHLELKRHYDTIVSIIADDVICDDLKQKLLNMYESLDALRRQWKRLLSDENGQPDALTLEELKLFECLVDAIRSLLKMI